MEKQYKYDLFLSFSFKNRKLVKPIWERFENSGLKVFCADKNLEKSIGLEFDDEIENALQQSQHFLLVCTPNAMASEWVRDEYKAFYHHIYKKSGKKRRFIILEGPDFDISSVPLFMRQLQIAKSIDEIIKTIADKKMPQKVGEKELISQKPEETLNTKKINPLNNKIVKWFGITIAVSVLIILVFLVIPPKKSPEKKPPKTKPFPGQKMYVTHLSFIAPGTFPYIIQSDITESINKAVVKGMNMGAKSNSKLQINAPGHEIPSSDSNAQKLIDILFDPDLKTIETVKIERIIEEIINPHDVDVIVICYCFNDADLWIKFRSKIIIKSQRQIVTRSLQFKESELVCESPISKKKILCKITFEQIAEDVKYFLEKL
jgi:hypothetical protein